MKKLLFPLLAALLITSLSVGCSALAGSTTQTQNVTLSAGQYETIPISLNSGHMITGSFAVSGPTDLDIKFSIEDPQGAVVYGPVRSRSQSFSYDASTAGTYYLYLDNTYSLLTSKAVTVTYTY
jgi:emp24/gp25L/p24 family/GOLD